MNFAQLGLALAEGIGLIVSPCILPILPIMLAASLDGGKRRPLGIIAGFILAFTVFALVSRQVLAWLDADPEIVRNVALGLLVLFGITLLSKNLSDKLLMATQGLANVGQNLTERWGQRNGFLGGVAIGGLIGLIWTPCAGPIMAAAVVSIIQAKTDVEAGLTIAMFALGAGLPMLAIALLGRQIISRFDFLKTHGYAVRRALGVVIILMAVLIYRGLDVQLLAVAQKEEASVSQTNTLQNALNTPYPAPEITGTQEWINSPPLKLADLRGKVVLIDFWTYSCINCLRTLPYVTAWYKKYRDLGFVVIGIHAPEFEFEKKIENVRSAVAKFGIQYPVAQDNDFATWTAYANSYWPAHYLIDKEGRVVYTHFGEGKYGITENNIRVLLGLNMEPEKPVAVPTAGFRLTPETYLGYGRLQNFANIDEAKENAVATYRFAPQLEANQWSLDGDWLLTEQNITSQRAGAALRLNFTSRKVFLVLGNKDGKPVQVRVTLNGEPAKGADVKDGVLTVDHEQLYELIDQGEAKSGLLELGVEEPGLQAYAFTFGG